MNFIENFLKENLTRKNFIKKFYKRILQKSFTKKFYKKVLQESFTKEFYKRDFFTDDVFLQKNYLMINFIKKFNVFM